MENAKHKAEYERKEVATKNMEEGKKKRKFQLEKMFGELADRKTKLKEKQDELKDRWQCMDEADELKKDVKLNIIQIDQELKSDFYTILESSKPAGPQTKKTFDEAETEDSD